MEAAEAVTLLAWLLVTADRRTRTEGQGAHCPTVRPSTAQTNGRLN